MIEEVMPGGAAFFDLDRTLIDVNSARLYADHERRAGRLSAWQMVQAGVWMGLYHFSLVDMRHSLKRAIHHYRGMKAATLDARTREWFFAEVEHRLRPGAMTALEAHRKAGEKLVLLTASSSFMAQVVCETWNLDGWIANRFELDPQGCLTGEVKEPVCYGPGKVACAEAWALVNRVDLPASTFYSDSHTDLPMLERVGRPRVVHPDPRLRRVAKTRNWPVLDWGFSSSTPKANFS
jgi:HAD superfamily hydrolase (TIGR01490 family)